MGATSRLAAFIVLALLPAFQPTSFARAVEAGADRDEQLFSDLRHGDEIRRIRAAEVIPGRADDAIKRAIPLLLENLRDRNQRVAESAHAALLRLGPKALPELIRALAEPWELRYRAISLIGCMGPAAADAVPALRKAMDSSVKALGIPLFPWEGRVLIADPLPRSPAALAGLRHGDWIVAVGSTPVEGASAADITRMIRSLPGQEAAISIRRKEHDPSIGYGPSRTYVLRREPIEDRRARFLAIEALGKIGGPAAEVLPELKAIVGDNDLDKPRPDGAVDDRRELRDAALQAIVSISPPKSRDLPILVEKIRGSDDVERVVALKKIAVLAPEHRDSILAIIDDMRVHKGMWNAILCRDALRAIAAAHPGAMPRLLGELPEETRCSLIGVLGDAVGSDPGLIPVLVACAEKPNCNEHEAAVMQLARLRPKSKEAQAVMLKSAADCGWGQRDAAIAALGELGPAAAGSIPGLLRVRYSDDKAIAAIQRMGPEVMPALVGELKAVEPSVRARAAKALGGMGPAAVPFLAKVVRQDGDDSVRLAAAEGLGQIGAPAEPILPAMALLLDNPVPMTRILAAKALLRVGSPALPWLAKLLSRERDTQVLQGVCEALAELGPAAEPALGALTGLLGSKDQNVRISAEIVLLKMGPAARPALPALIRAASTDYVAVRTLGVIGPPAADAIPVLQGLLASPTNYMRLEAKSALLRITAAGTVVAPSKPDLGKARKTMAGGGQCPISQFGLDPSVREMTTSGWGGVCIWSLDDDKIESPALGGGLEPALLSSDGRSLVSFAGPMPRLADVATRRWRQLEASPVRPTLTALSADGSTLLAWGQAPADGAGGTLVLWNLAKPWVRPSTAITKERLTSLCVSGDGNTLMAGSGAGSVFTIARDSLALSGEIPTLFDAAVSRCVLDLRGRAAAVGASNGAALVVRNRTGWTTGPALWRSSSGTWLQTLAISPDAARVAAATSDRLLTVWTTGEPGKTRAWEASRSGLREISFTPDGRLLGAVGQEQELRLWEPSSGNLEFLLTNSPRTEKPKKFQETSP